MTEPVEVTPLKTLEEVFNWSPHGEKDLFPHETKRSRKFLSGDQWVQTDRSWESLVKIPFMNEDCGRPKTLVCHDMMGGYLQDRFVDGCQEDGYHFRHWSQIDIFVYFSHHFVTIPPPGWVSAARTHGVQILGTIITEWDQGQEILEEIIKTEENIDKFVSVCVDIAKFHGFHGWLLNIENPVKKELVEGLLKLVQRLTEGVRQGLRGGSVIWYDSVTTEGELKWQNELNRLNKPFFDLCDGIFLNYTWKIGDCSENSTDSTLKTGPVPNNLANSIESLGNESRRADIFVGVDVFGRGCLGDGGFNCDKALSEIRKLELSVAIFAPGWTYEIAKRESDSVENKSKLPLERNFFLREHIFWERLISFLYFRVPNLQSESEEKKVHNSAHQIFHTSFSLGRGSSSLGRTGWFNLKKMEFQPTLPIIPYMGERNEDSEVPKYHRCFPYSCFTSEECSWNQSQSLQLVTERKQTIPIFLCDLDLKPDTCLLFVLIYKANMRESSENEEFSIHLMLGTDDENEISPEILTKPELLSIYTDWDLTPIENNKPGWEIVAFLTEGEICKTIRKIGIDIEKCDNFYIGQFSIYSKYGLMDY